MTITVRERYTVRVVVVDGGYEAQLVRDANGVVVYTANRPGDAQRAVNAALNGYGVIDHHGRTFRHNRAGKSVEVSIKV